MPYTLPLCTLLTLVLAELSFRLLYNPITEDAPFFTDFEAVASISETIKRMLYDSKHG